MMRPEAMIQAYEINLIPPDVLMEEKTQRRIWIWSGILLLIMLCLSGAYGVELKKINAVESVITDLSIKKDEIEKMIKQLAILQEKRDRLALKERGINMLLNKRSISQLFAELEQTMNENLWLTSFHFKDAFALMKGTGTDDEGDAWVETGYFIVKENGTGKKKTSHQEAPAVTTVLRGMAQSNRDLAHFLEALSGSALFSEVNLKYSREGTSGGPKMVEFEIETNLKRFLNR